MIRRANFESSFLNYYNIDEQALWPFATGAASASIFWGVVMYVRQRRLIRRLLLGDESDDNYRLIKARAIAEYIKSRIGELPRKPSMPMRWPWDRMDRSLSSSSLSSALELDGTVIEEEGESELLPENKKLGVCIGSIFGLDVGGTLAKLVYFDINASPAVSRRSSVRPISSTNSFTEEDIPDEKALPELSPLKKRSLSMFDLTTQNHAKALHSFYEFANHLDQFGESGIKEKHLSFYSRALGGEFHFIQFETRNMMNAMHLIQSNQLNANIVEMGATGGGAHKYADMWEKNLGINMKKIDEMESLVAGMQFVLEDGNAIGESFTFKPEISKEESWKDEGRTSQNFNAEDNSKSKDEMIKSVLYDDERLEPSEEKKIAMNNKIFVDKSTPSTKESYEAMPLTNLRNHSGSRTDNSLESNESKTDYLNQDPTALPKLPVAHGDENWSTKVQLDRPLDSSSYPYLVVIIGTGVSILRVDGPRKHERISGSTIGGGTYLGLCRLLTDMEDYQDVMNLAACGDPSKVDMTVGDIYGKNSNALEKLGLPAWLVASSFGKLVTKEDPASDLRQEDLARALLIMVTNNIGQVAYLNAQLHNTSRLYFVGNFLRHNNISQRRLAYAIDYWSKGKMEALFLEHEGYFGALGAFLLSQGIPTEMVKENKEKEEINSKQASLAKSSQSRGQSIAEKVQLNLSDSLSTSLRNLGLSRSFTE